MIHPNEISLYVFGFIWFFISLLSYLYMTGDVRIFSLQDFKTALLGSMIIGAIYTVILIGLYSILYIVVEEMK